ncbi:MAG: ion transporter [Halieaceae bacterium]|nr:ion transporter [Halieaceae bacterium]
MVREQTELQKKFYDVIFGTTRGAGRNFDIALILLILASVTVVLLDSIPEYHTNYGALFLQIEWGFTIIFTIEYLTRLWCSPNRKRYALSAFGLVDLLAILPTYLAMLFPGANTLLMIRLIRILRIFRVLRLLQFLSEANVLARALRNSRRKIFVFFSLMLVLMTVFGSLMYVIEGPVHGFGTIPESIYWAIVTITTVGYGDVVPHTALGRSIAAFGMLIGYAIIAVPTGIITAELATEIGKEKSRFNCRNCERSGHDVDARYCKYCGAQLPERETNQAA